MFVICFLLLAHVLSAVPLLCEQYLRLTTLEVVVESCMECKKIAASLPEWRLTYARTVVNSRNFCFLVYLFL